MKNYKTVLILAVGLLLSSCASLSGDPHPGKLEHVGVLLVKNCAQSSECDQYSLLGQDMKSRSVILSGDIDASLKGRLIAVLGTDVSNNSAMKTIHVEQSKSIVEFDYQPFLNQAVADYTKQNFQCMSFWDQSYGWELEGRQPILIATLRHPKGADSGAVELRFDGLNKALLSADRIPEDANPCQLR
jgi:hypothetical protein